MTRRHWAGQEKKIPVADASVSRERHNIFSFAATNLMSNATRRRLPNSTPSESFCVVAAWLQCRNTLGTPMKIARRPQLPIRLLTLWALATLAAILGEPSLAAPALGDYNIDPSRISVSGFSAGGFFAMQMAVAYSSVFHGVAIFAGGPYDCARNASVFGCVDNVVPDISSSIANMRSWSANRIDDIKNINKQRVYIFVGKDDGIVGPNVAQQVKRLYLDDGGFAAIGNVKYVELEGINHTFPTNFNRAGDSPCGYLILPFISNCKFDGAGDALQWIYGALNEPNTGSSNGELVAFDQTPFIGHGSGMDKTGWLYVPASCAAGRRCALHVALHGCQQAYAFIGAYFLNNTGYNRWADTNNMILLYPQTSASLSNPFSCWDWIGLYGPNYDQKSGIQMRAIMAMVQHIARSSSAIARR